jgi:hypothetical protein
MNNGPEGEKPQDLTEVLKSIGKEQLLPKF